MPPAAHELYLVALSYRRDFLPRGVILSPGVILNLIQDPRLIIRPHPTSPHNDGS